MNKVLFITGSRKGIGRFLSEYYLEKGYVVYGCSRSSTDLKHPNYQHFEGDIADERFVQTMFATVRKKAVPGYLINNAGVASMNHSMLTPKMTVDKVFATNVTGTFLVTREATRLMRKQGGRIVNFTSVASPLSLEGESIYAASKHAVEKMTHVLAKELSPFNITVNAIGPTPIKTDLIKAVPQAKIDILLRNQAIPRMGEYSDISNVVDFFFHENSQFITGQILYLGGVVR